MIGRTLGRPGLRFGWGFTSCAFVCSGFLRGRPRFFGSGALSLPGKASSKAASSSPSHFSRRFQYSSSTCGRLSRGALRLRQHVLSESMTSPNVALSSTRHALHNAGCQDGGNEVYEFGSADGVVGLDPGYAEIKAVLVNIEEHLKLPALFVACVDLSARHVEIRLKDDCSIRTAMLIVVLLVV